MTGLGKHSPADVDFLLLKKPWQFCEKFKGMFNSGLEDALAIHYCDDLASEQPCELIHNNYQMRKRLVFEN